MQQITYRTYNNFAFADARFIRLGDTNLIWYQNTQAGTKYFRRHFARACYLKKVNFDDINWNTDHVFGHIIDPIERRHRSTAIWFKLNNLDNLLRTDNKFLAVLQGVYFHSDCEPISISAKDKINAINWIPLDVEQIDYIVETKKILNAHGIEIVFQPTVYPESEERIQLLNIIRDHYSSNAVYHNIIERVFQEDTAVYNAAVEKYLTNI
jgi:hypothetical protein